MVLWPLFFCLNVKILLKFIFVLFFDILLQHQITTKTNIMKRKQLEFPLEVLNERLFYVNHCIEKFKDDKYIINRLRKNAKELEYVIKLIELQIEVNKINFENK